MITFFTIHLQDHVQNLVVGVEAEVEAEVEVEVEVEVVAVVAAVVVVEVAAEVDQHLQLSKVDLVLDPNKQRLESFVSFDHFFRIYF